MKRKTIPRLRQDGSPVNASRGYNPLNRKNISQWELDQIMMSEEE